jgi:hypothetical protein
MRRRKPKRTPIPVEDRSYRDWVSDWITVGGKLHQLEPERFRQIAALAEAYVSNHDRELETDAEFQARLLRASVDAPEPN